MRRASGVSGPLNREQVDLGLKDGTFHVEMPASIDRGTTWHPLRLHLDLPNPAPRKLPASLENPDPPPRVAEPARPDPAPVEPGYLRRRYMLATALLAGFLQGFVPVAVPSVGGLVYLLVGQHNRARQHRLVMASCAEKEAAAIAPGDIERSADPALWLSGNRPLVALELVVEVARKAEQRIDPQTVLRLAGAGITADALEVERLAGKEWVRGEQAEGLRMAARAAQGAISQAERVEDVAAPGAAPAEGEKKPLQRIDFVRREAVERSAAKAWQEVMADGQALVDDRRKKAEAVAAPLNRVLAVAREPALRELLPGLDALCENPPAAADLPAALARVRAGGRKAVGGPPARPDAGKIDRAGQDQ